MNYALLQWRIDKGIGHCGVHVGQPFSVFRPSAAGLGGDFPAGWELLASNQPLYRERAAAPKLETGNGKGALWYSIYGNIAAFDLGDVMLCTDPPYRLAQAYGDRASILPATDEINGFSLVWHMPAYVPIGARCDRLVRISRPASSPATMPDSSGYWKSTYDNDQPLIFAGGEFAFGPPGSGLGSLVPAGFSIAFRPSGALPFGPPVPGMIRPTHWYCFIPPLPGYFPTEGDAIVSEADARYVIAEPYRQESGVVGSTLMVDRYISQAG